MSAHNNRSLDHACRRWQAGRKIKANFLLIVFAASYAANAATMLYAGRAGLPPEPGDGPSYDNIATQLAHGRGFGHGFDPEWRRPYQEHNLSGEYDVILSRQTPYSPTTLRSPAMPALLACIYLTCGRSFLIWQLISCAIMAASITLAAAICLQLGGVRAAGCSAAIAIASPQLRQYSFLMLTESLACLAVVTLLWAVIKLRRSEKLRWAVVCGTCLGCAVLIRGVFAFWLFWLPAIIWCAAGWSGTKSTYRRIRTRAAIVCLLVGTATALPWCVRNCIILKAFMPLGAVGGVSMHAAYSSDALANRGVWRSAVKTEAERYERVGDLAREREVARQGMLEGIAWIKKNIASIPLLMFYKAIDLWRPPTGYAVLLTFAGIAMVVGWRKRGSVSLGGICIVIGFLIANTLSVALTWSVGWRFNVPLEPLLHILGGIGLAASLFGDRVFEGSRAESKVSEMRGPGGTSS